MTRTAIFCSLLPITLSFFFAGCSQREPQKSAEQNPRWEYRMVADPATAFALETAKEGETLAQQNLIKDFLAKLGEDGWELVAIEDGRELEPWRYYWQKNTPPTVHNEIHPPPSARIDAATPPVAIDPKLLEELRQRQEDELAKEDNVPTTRGEIPENQATAVDDLLTEIDSVKLEYSDQRPPLQKQVPSKIWIFKRRVVE